MQCHFQIDIQLSNYYYYYGSFSHQLYLMVFHWSLSDSKSLGGAKTLLKILTDFSCSVVRMVSIFPLIIEALFQVLGIVPKVPVIVSLSHSCSTPFLVLWQSLGIFQLFAFFHFHSVGKQNSLWQVGLFKSTRLWVEVWSSGLDWVICFYYKIQENFIRFIFKNRFSSIGKFQFLAPFPWYNLSQPFVPVYLFLMC